MIGKVGRLMKIRSQWFLVFIIILLFSLAGCKSQEAPVEYGIVVQLDREWWPKNLLEYPFTRWTYMFKPDGKKVIPPRRFGITFSWYSAFSPNGEWLAYQNVWNGQIYVMKVSDGEKFKVSSGSEEIAVNAIRWLGDGHTIVYGDDKVYIQDLSCLLTKKLSSNCLPSPSIIKLGVNTSFEDISPDGKKIICTRYKYEDYVPVESNTLLMEITQYGPVSLPLSLAEQEILIQFIDNTSVLVGSGNSVYIAEVADKGLSSKRLITTIEMDAAWGISLSPDGKYIAFISDQDEGLGEAMDPYPGWDSVTPTSALFVMEVTTGQMRRLTYPNDHYVIWYGWYPLR